MKVSIVTITFNAARTLQRTLDSVACQTYADIEHLIIDGASKDDTLAIALQYQEQSRHQVVIQSEPDRGLYDAMNKGLQKATGDYLVFLNAGDTLYAPDTIETVVRCVQQPPLLLERAGGEAGLYAIGDANGRQMLAHAAEMQAVHAVNHILGKTDAIRFDIMPAAIFTEPEAACVGPTEDQLKEQGIPYECHKAFWRANGKALAMGETEGMLKLFITPPSQGGDGGESRILGCHAFGAHAADIVQEVSVLMCRDTTVAQLRDMVHIHPTLGEILVSAVL